MSGGKIRSCLLRLQNCHLRISQHKPTRNDLTVVFVEPGVIVFRDSPLAKMKLLGLLKTRLRALNDLHSRLNREHSLVMSASDTSKARKLDVSRFAASTAVMRVSQDLIQREIILFQLATNHEN